MDERGPAREAAPVGQPVESAGTPALHGESSVRARKSAEMKARAVPGLEFPRYFTRLGVDPFDEVEWEVRSAVIGNEQGRVVFEQRDDARRPCGVDASGRPAPAQLHHCLRR